MKTRAAIPESKGLATLTGDGDKNEIAKISAGTKLLQQQDRLLALKAIEDKFEKQIQWLKDKDPLTRALKGYESAVDWLYRRDNSKDLPLFFKKTKLYDKIRNENTTKTFPEWRELFEKYET